MNGNQEKLTEELKERLRWYQEEASDEEIDAEEITQILQLLDKLDPLPDDGVTPQEAYAAFERKCMPEAEEMADTAEVEAKAVEGIASKAEAGKEAEGKASKRRFLGTHRVLRRVAIALIAVLALFSLLDIGSYATAKKGFFELLRDWKQGQFIFVTGEEQDVDIGDGFRDKDRLSYTTWEDVPKEISDKICRTEYIPRGLKLTRIDCTDSQLKDRVKIIYEGMADDEFLIIVIEHFEDEQSWHLKMYPEAEFLEKRMVNGREVFFYQYEENVIAGFQEKDLLYKIHGNYSTDELEKVIKNMK